MASRPFASVSVAPEVGCEYVKLLQGGSEVRHTICTECLPYITLIDIDTHTVHTYVISISYTHTRTHAHTHSTPYRYMYIQCIYCPLTLKTLPRPHPCSFSLCSFLCTLLGVLYKHTHTGMSTQTHLKLIYIRTMYAETPGE